MSAFSKQPLTSETPRLTRESWVKVSLAPFPQDRMADLWAWLHQFPAANFDDTAPETLAEFEASFDIMARGNRQLWGASIDGELLGAIGFESLSKRTALLRGICFDQSAHGSEAPFAAVAKILDLAWKSGFEKVSARYMAHNRRVHQFFKKLGARQEGFMIGDTTQAGQPVDVRIVAFFAPKREK